LGVYDEDEEFEEYIALQSDGEAETDNEEVTESAAETTIETADEETAEIASDTETASDVTTQPADSEPTDNSEDTSAAPATASSVQVLVNKNICDFNGDGKFNVKDKLYLLSSMHLTASKIDNRTHKNRVLVSEYTTE
jgi:cytoskeletal protein RodZ